MVAVGRDVVGETAIRTRVAVRGLLAQEIETDAVLEDDVVAVRARGPVTVDTARLQRTVTHDLIQKLLRLVVELLGRRLVKDRRKLALLLPRVGEELPVDVVSQGRELGRDGLRPRERRCLE